MGRTAEDENKVKKKLYYEQSSMHSHAVHDKNKLEECEYSQMWTHFTIIQQGSLDRRENQFG